MRFRTELLIQLASVILKHGCFYFLIRTQLLLPEHLHDVYIQPRKLGGIKISHPASWPIHGLTELQIYFTQIIITLLKPSVSDLCSFTAKNCCKSGLFQSDTLLMSLLVYLLSTCDTTNPWPVVTAVFLHSGVYKKRSTNCLTFWLKASECYVNTKSHQIKAI